MKKNKVIFLDRDGTINVDYEYVHDKNKLEFIDGSIEGLKKMQEMGFKLIIITNQSGIGRGYFTLEEYYNFNSYFLEELKSYGINIEKVYFCPHIHEDNCECRKPKIGMFKKAIDDYNVDIEKSFAIGDKERDLCICKQSSVSGIIVGNKNDSYPYFNNLLDVANYIGGLL